MTFDHPDWTLQRPAGTIATLVQAVIASEPGSTTVPIAAVTGRRIVIVEFAAMASGGRSMQNSLRDQCELLLQDNVSGAILAMVVVSPENPYVVEYPPGDSAAAIAGHPVRMFAQARVGSGSQYIDTVTRYFLG